MVFQFTDRLVIPRSAIKRMLTSYQLRSITVRQTYWNGTNLGLALYSRLDHLMKIMAMLQGLVI